MEGGKERGGNPVNYYTLAKTTEDSQIEESNNKCMMVDDEEEEELKVDRTRIPDLPTATAVDEVDDNGSGG